MVAAFKFFFIGGLYRERGKGKDGYGGRLLTVGQKSQTTTSLKS